MTDDSTAAARASFDDAWKEYMQALEDCRRQMLREPLAGRSPDMVAQIAYLTSSLAAHAHEYVMAPRSHYPMLYCMYPRLPSLPLLLPCPDFYYRESFLDGARTYRIRGRRRTAHWESIQIQSGVFGADGARKVAHLHFDELRADADGRFELTIGGPERPGNWMPLAPEARSHHLLIRSALVDWDRAEPSELELQLADDAPREPHALSMEAIAARYRLMARMIRFTTDNWNDADYAREALDAVGTNRFIQHAVTEKTMNRAGNPGNQTSFAVFDIGPDEALIVESEVPVARYWGVHMSDVWFQAADFVDHQSSISCGQARLDADGRFRAVIAYRDPGVPNWLDPVGIRPGVVFFRYYWSDRHPLPTATRVPLARVREHLPRETPVVTPVQRAEAIARRGAAARRRLGRY
ncbi:MAG: hypothetical protein AB7Q97_00165 [Gammaproteobacteria bacterium]